MRRFGENGRQEKRYRRKRKTNVCILQNTEGFRMKEAWRHLVSFPVFYSFSLPLRQRLTGECCRMQIQTSLFGFLKVPGNRSDTGREKGGESFYIYSSATHTYMIYSASSNNLFESLFLSVYCTVKTSIYPAS